MKIDIADYPDNWKNWGDLVRKWISNQLPLPADTTAMQAQISAAGVDATIPGPPRAVEFVPYNPNALQFMLPTDSDVTDAEAELSNIATQQAGQRQYPLPSFYPIAFGGAREVDLSLDELLAFGRRRLGEYVVQECQ
jgi:hypothetical protein